MAKGVWMQVNPAADFHFYRFGHEKEASACGKSRTFLPPVRTGKGANGYVATSRGELPPSPERWCCPECRKLSGQ